MTRKFDYRQLLPIISMGLVEGSIVLLLMTSLALFVFSGELAAFAPRGIGIYLFGSLIMQLVVALTSSMPGLIGSQQDSPVAILSLVAITIFAKMSGAPADAKFITILVTIILTSVISGLFFIPIGAFKLSRFVRFIPYPVVGGFIAGTGFLLVRGA